MIKRISRAVAALVPGTRSNISKRKRQMETTLRAQGYSRTHAMAIVAERFKEK